MKNQARKPLLDNLKKEDPVAAAVQFDMERARLASERKQLQAKYDDAILQLETANSRIELLAALKDDGSRKVPKWAAAKRARTGSATAGILISDYHAEETVVPEEVNGMNEYTLDTADASLKRVFQKALLLIEDARSLANIRSLVVWLGGDMISGHLHPELAENNSLSPLSATLWVSERLEAGLRLLVDQSGMDDITIVTSYGNHGRDTVKPRAAGAADRSYEHNMYLTLRQRVSDPKVNWQLGIGYHNYLDVQGYLCRFHHGDAIRYQGGVGGISIPVNKAIAAWNKSQRADFDFFGHWHCFLWHYSWVCNGSMIGYSPFSVRIKADYQEPLQTFFVIDKGRGMTRAMPIYCRPEKDEVALAAAA